MLPQTRGALFSRGTSGPGANLPKHVRNLRFSRMDSPLYTIPVLLFERNNTSRPSITLSYARIEEREYETYSPTSTGSRSIVHFTAGLGSLNGSQLGPSAPSTRSIGVSEKPRTFRDVPRRVRGTIRSGFDPENRVRSCPSCSGPTCLASGQLSCVAPGRPLQHFRLVHSGATRLQSSMPFVEWDDPCAGGPQLS